MADNGFLSVVLLVGDFWFVAYYTYSGARTFVEVHRWRCPKPCVRQTKQHLKCMCLTAPLVRAVVCRPDFRERHTRGTSRQVRGRRVMNRGSSLNASSAALANLTLELFTPAAWLDSHAHNHLPTRASSHPHTREAPGTDGRPTTSQRGGPAGCRVSPVTCARRVRACVGWMGRGHSRREEKAQIIGLKDLAELADDVQQNHAPDEPHAHDEDEGGPAANAHVTARVRTHAAHATSGQTNRVSSPDVNVVCVCARAHVCCVPRLAGAGRMARASCTRKWGCCSCWRSTRWRTARGSVSLCRLSPLHALSLFPCCRWGRGGCVASWSRRSSTARARGHRHRETERQQGERSSVRNQDGAKHAQLLPHGVIGGVGVDRISLLRLGAGARLLALAAGRPPHAAHHQRRRTTRASGIVAGSTHEDQHTVAVLPRTRAMVTPEAAPGARPIS
jgi:hypothetical protein